MLITRNDPCADLCLREGRAVCSNGSWTKADGSCQAYVFRTSARDDDYCYHVTETAGTCPGNALSVKAVDATRLLLQGFAPDTTTSTEPFRLFGDKYA
jgi:hypothetical protein